MAEINYTPSVWSLYLRFGAVDLSSQGDLEVE